MWLISNCFAYFISAVIGVVILGLFSNKCRKCLYNLKQVRYSNSMTITEITNERECEKACLVVKSHCQDLSALGFDCEWISPNGIERPVALLQLATVHGYCYLFRLNILQCIPQNLKDILCDPKIIKLGVAPLDDSIRLGRDYSTQVHSTLDLRHLYPEGRGLAHMAASEIGIQLDKNWRIKTSNWERTTLQPTQKDYAAKDAFVAIEIFKKWLLTKKQMLDLHRTAEYSSLLNEFTEELSRYLDIRFSQKMGKTAVKSGKNINQKRPKSFYQTRKTPLYHNCFMHAPDGGLLCSCDRRKAQWYVERGLAEVLPGEPYSIRLLFEPAARPGDTDGERFYQHLKKNCCVVCGALESHLRHNVVPKEYRKHFPNIMKDHQSHDIVLMCVKCHFLASQKNEILKNTLADYCKAPVTASKVTTVRALQKVKNSAKALLNAGDLIPKGRKEYLESVINKYYGVDTLSPELLKAAAGLESNIINEQYDSHGLKVVNYFAEKKGGLTELEILWRTHFLDTMKPRYLPALWSVTHNHNRLAALVDQNPQ